MAEVVDHGFRAVVPGPGCGGRLRAALQGCAGDQSNTGILSFEIMDGLAEPSDCADDPLAREDALEQLSRALRHGAASTETAVLVCCSRGGYFASELRRKGLWDGPTLMLAASSTVQTLTRLSADGRALEEIGSGVLFYHGTEDKTYLIDSVRAAKSFASALLVEAPGDTHHLESLTAKKLEELVTRAVSWSAEALSVAAYVASATPPPPPPPPGAPAPPPPPASNSSAQLQGSGNPVATRALMLEQIRAAGKS